MNAILREYLLVCNYAKFRLITMETVSNFTVRNRQVKSHHKSTSGSTTSTLIGEIPFLLFN